MLFLAAAGLSAYNYFDGMRAYAASTRIAEKLSEQIVQNILSSGGSSGDRSGTSPGSTNTGSPGYLSGTSAGSSHAASDGGGQGGSGSEAVPLETVRARGVSVLPETAAPYEEMPTAVIDGERYIGMLEIPSLGLTLPVMENWDYEKLKVSPCRFSGSYYSDDLVICAHNYARHFSPIKWIGIGEDVFFTNVNGVRMQYKTTNIVTVQPSSVEEMIRNTGADASGKKQWDMTLFTCNTGGQTRCAVRCVRAEA